MLHSGTGRSFGHVNRRSAGSSNGGSVRSASTLTRTSGVSTYPPTIDFTRPIDWQNGDTALMQRSQDVTFATGVTEVTQTMAGGTVTYNFGLSSVVSGIWYFRMAAWSGTRPASLTWSNLQGVGDTTAPSITSSSTITLASGVASNLSLTANETVTWAITGGANQDQYSLSGSTLTCASQVASGSYVVQVTATDICGNTTNQTITATLSIAEFSSAATDKNPTLTLSGTPKVVATGQSGTGSEMNVRTSYVATGKRAWECTPTLEAGDQVSMQMDDGTVDYSAYGHIVGISTSNGIALTVNGANWYLQYSGGYNQSGSSSPHVAGDIYMCEYDTATQSYAFFRRRSGVKTQLGTTVTGIGTFTHASVCVKNGSVMTANFGPAGTFASTPTAGYGAFNA